MSKFAKLFDVGEDQVLVYIDTNDGEYSCIRIVAKVDNAASTTILAFGARATHDGEVDESHSRLLARYDAFDNAEAVKILNDLRGKSHNDEISVATTEEECHDVNVCADEPFEYDLNRPVPNIRLDHELKYDPNYGDDLECECGHSYYRHFDSYENMDPVGCKYCQCTIFSKS